LPQAQTKHVRPALVTPTQEPREEQVFVAFLHVSSDVKQVDVEKIGAVGGMDGMGNGDCGGWRRYSNVDEAGDKMAIL